MRVANAALDDLAERRVCTPRKRVGSRRMKDIPGSHASDSQLKVALLASQSARHFAWMVDYQRLEGHSGDTSATAAAAPAERSWLPGVGVFLVVVGISVLGFISLQPGPAPPAPPVIAQEESGWKAEPSAVKGARGRLRITNGCAEDDLWLAHFAFQTPYFPQDLKLKSGATHEFAIPDCKKVNVDQSSAPQGQLVGRAGFLNRFF